MSAPGFNGADADQLRSIIDRILHARMAEDDAKDVTKDIYAEAKANGFDKAALGRVVAHLRAVQRDRAKVEERESLFDLYLRSYEGAASHVHAGAREEVA